MLYKKISFDNILISNSRGTDSQINYPVRKTESENEYIHNFILTNVSLQIVIAKCIKMPTYIERILLKSSKTSSIVLQESALRTIFKNVELMQNKNIHYYEVHTLTPQARVIWSQLLSKKMLDPIFLHLSGRLSAENIHHPYSISTYEFIKPNEYSSTEIDSFLNTPWFKSILSDDFSICNLPIVDVSGWSMDELLKDRYVKILASIVSHLYYCEFTGVNAFEKQLRLFI